MSLVVRAARDKLVIRRGSCLAAMMTGLTGKMDAGETARHMVELVPVGIVGQAYGRTLPHG